MKSLMNQYLILTLILVVISCGPPKKLDRDTEEWRYQVEAVNTGKQGSYLIKVWTYAQKVEWAEQQAPKNAVHAVIFKGFPSKDRVKGQKPLVSAQNNMGDNDEFFKDFFKDGGEYSRFVTLVNSGAIAPGDVVKVGKEFKVGYTTSVSVGELRKYLEQNEIIKALDSGF